MPLSTKAKMLIRMTLNPHNLFCTNKYLFILSHMRSRSSVLAHILGSNSNICGYRELGCPYSSRLSLKKMNIALSYEMHCNLKEKYLLDKILHNYFISEKVLNFSRLKAIFLLRNPNSTIKSIINMGHITGKEWYKDPSQAMEYYCSRLATLQNYSEKLDGRYLFVESSELVDNTERTLEEITEWLDLDEPLSKNYSTFKNTGRPGYSDPSRNIMSGVIIRTEGHPDIHIPEEILSKGKLCYKKCRERLLGEYRSKK